MLMLWEKLFRLYFIAKLKQRKILSYVAFIVPLIMFYLLNFLLHSEQIHSMLLHYLLSTARTALLLSKCLKIAQLSHYVVLPIKKIIRNQTYC